MTRSRPGQTDLSKCWDEWHQGRDLLEHEGRVPVRAPWRELARGLLPASLEGLRVIDIGCARGGFTRELAEGGADVTAVDFSSVAVDLTRRQLGSRGGKVVVADARELPFTDGSFDVALCLQTPNHVTEPRRVLAEAVRVTKESGLIVVTIQNHLSLLGFGRFLLRLTRRQGGLPPVANAVTLLGMWRALCALGCRIEAIEGHDHLVVVPGFRTVSLRWPERHRSLRYVASHVGLAARKTPG